MPIPTKRGQAPLPPDKGSFPLDHFGECRPFQLEYLQCVREEKNKTAGCKGQMKAYLECRMNNGLMAQEDLSQLGFAEHNKAATPSPSSTSPSAAQSQEAKPASQTR